jgi:hypothetical protein
MTPKLRWCYTAVVLSAVGLILWDSVYFSEKERQDQVLAELNIAEASVWSLSPDELVKLGDKIEALPDSSKKITLTRNPLAVRALRLHNWKKERDAILAEVNSETIADTVFALKSSHFSWHFSPKLSDSSFGFPATTSEVISEISNDPRVKKLLTVAQSGTSAEKDELHNLLQNEYYLHGLGSDFRRQNGDIPDVDGSPSMSIPFIIAKLDSEGESLGILVDIANNYVANDYHFGGDPQVDGNGVTTYFSSTLAVSVESVLLNLATSLDQKSYSETLSDYMNRYEQLSVELNSSTLNAMAASATNEGFEDLPSAGFATMMDHVIQLSTPLSKPLLEYAPDWLVAGNFDWLTIAYAVRINSEISDDKKRQHSLHEVTAANSENIITQVHWRP